ncbi:DUF308 domain-containing protein [Bradyrhizobium jicamae]|uniref:DUF308 domain-containing protein n=1 Tax=Bradyrhizobium jicamae TaxID=280332 RepID=UPI001BAAC1BD|nr:DUF308 domain-containing protein [Bradyrhizobium jicamae]MBR0934836.1 DUF308 domain-containing protein [Bradyrhizobium jicamae]
MVVALLVAGMGLILAGLAAIGLGIPYKEFSVGSTLITTGVSGVCTGAIILALAAAVRELRRIARRLGPGGAVARPEFPLSAPATSPRSSPPVEAGFSFPRDQHAAAEPPPLVPPSAPAASPPPWHEEAIQRAAPADAAPPTPAAAPTEASAKRRNLLFSSSRKDRERTQARAAELLSPDLPSPDPLPSPAAASDPSAPTFDDAWPRAERPRSVDVASRRSPRTPSTFTEAQSAPPSPGHPPAPVEQPPVTVLKSGVVDGMAYSLYSDGSIEAQMPEGMMRFASIDELRSHLEQRP